MAGLVPAIPMLKSVAPHRIEITGTRPVMTGAGCEGYSLFFAGPVATGRSSRAPHSAQAPS